MKAGGWPPANQKIRPCVPSLGVGGYRKPAGAGLGRGQEPGIPPGRSSLHFPQAGMVFCLMNQDIQTTVPGVKNTAETEEIAGSVHLPPIPEHHLRRVRELYSRDFPK